MALSETSIVFAYSVVPLPVPTYPVVAAHKTFNGSSFRTTPQITAVTKKTPDLHSNADKIFLWGAYDDFGDILEKNMNYFYLCLFQHKDLPQKMKHALRTKWSHVPQAFGLCIALVIVYLRKGGFSDKYIILQ